MKENNIVIKVTDIGKKFWKKEILRKISFEIGKGELTAITGENGSGKSTLLKILVGILKPNNGKIIINGKIGYCPQDQLIFNNLTVNENFKYYESAYGLISKNKMQSQKRRSELMTKFHFDGYENILVSDLSGGTKQKLNLSLSLLHEPDILILDEPYSGFEWETYLRFWSFAKELRNKKVSILIVSHLIYDRSFFDTIYEIKEGYLNEIPKN